MQVQHPSYTANSVQLFVSFIDNLSQGKDMKDNKKFKNDCTTIAKEGFQEASTNRKLTGISM